MRYKLILMLAAIATTLLLASANYAQESDGSEEEEALNTGRIVSVVAYRGQALVTREIEVPEDTGLIEVVVSGLPVQVFPDSLFSDGVEGVDVRAVRYRTRVIGKDVRENVQATHEAIEELNKRLRENQTLTTLAARQLVYLDKLEAFTAPTAMEEMRHGVLNAEQLKTMTTFTFEQREALTRKTLELAENARVMGRDKADLEYRLRQLGAGSSRLEREAVVFVDKQRPGAARIKLSYLAGSVNWRPVYNVRAESGRDTVQVEYSALVTQASGEDWEGVGVTLSTASPALIAQGADLLPMMVSLTPRVPHPARAAEADNADMYDQKWRGLREKQLKAARSGRGGGPSDDSSNARSPRGSLEEYKEGNLALGQELNRIASQLQAMEFEASEAVIKVVHEQSEGISVEYKLPGSISLASRHDHQLVSIADHSFKADNTFVATPVLSDYVYLQAEAKNDSNTVLLEGGYTAYLDGRFVGRSAIPTVARGESFTVGFGIDSQLRVSRELVEKESRVQGGNRVASFTYRLMLKNYKDSEVTVRIMDRMPNAETKEIRQTLTKTSEELSTDKVYIRDQKPKGILRWDVKVAAGATGADAREITYSYTLEYDRQMRVTVLPNQ